MYYSVRYATLKDVSIVTTEQWAYFVEEHWEPQIDRDVIGQIPSISRIRTIETFWLRIESRPFCILSGCEYAFRRSAFTGRVNPISVERDGNWINIECQPPRYRAFATIFTPLSLSAINPSVQPNPQIRYASTFVAILTRRSWKAESLRFAACQWQFLVANWRTKGRAISSRFCRVSWNGEYGTIQF